MADNRRRDEVEGSTVVEDNDVDGGEHSRDRWIGVSMDDDRF
jgi:hypothetical protein